MRNIFLLILTIISINITLAQGCLPNGIIFTSQNEIDNFQTNYPGCNYIEGDIIIGGYQHTDITNFTGLNSLDSIGGGLWIGKNDHLRNFNGLDNLISIGGNFEIESNPSLVSLEGLSGMAIIRGNLIVQYNDYLIDLNGLSNLIQLEGSIAISSNMHLQNVSVFDFLESVRAIYIDNNPDLIDLDGLNNITTVENYLDIERNSFTNLHGLENLSTIGGRVWIRANDSLTDLSGLENLDSIGGELSISINFLLTNLHGLQNLKFVGESVWIVGNHALPDLSGLNSLDSVDGALNIWGNNNLMSFSGLEGLKGISGGVDFNQNHRVINFIGLDNLKSIGGEIEIFANDSLISLQGLQNISAGTISSIYIADNQRLNTCHIQSICDYLTKPDGTVQIHNNTIGCENREEIEIRCSVDVNTSEMMGDEPLKIYPNPSATIIFIKSANKSNKYQVSLLNAFGQQLISTTNTELSNGINISNLPAGMYYVSTNGDNFIQRGKFIKN